MLNDFVEIPMEKYANWDVANNFLTIRIELMIINKVNEKVRNNKVIWTRNDSKIINNTLINFQKQIIDRLEKTSTCNFRQDFNFISCDFKYQIYKFYAS